MEYYSDRFEQKLDAIKKGGKSSLAYKIDFDWTLTSAESPSTHQCLKDARHMPQAYVDAVQNFFQFYYPRVVDQSRPLRFRDKMMKRWEEREISAAKKYGLTQDIVKEVADQDYLIPRIGAEQFLHETEQTNTPLLIISAGLGEIIEGFLSKRGNVNGNKYIISNFFRYNANGRIKGYAQNSIHILNKTAHRVLGTNFYKNNLEGKKNIILMGDHIEDITMSHGLAHENCLNILFKNDNSKSLESYLQVADMVIENRDSMEPVNEIIKQIK